MLNFCPSVIDRSWLCEAGSDLTRFDVRFPETVKSGAERLEASPVRRAPSINPHMQVLPGPGCGSLGSGYCCTLHIHEVVEPPLPFVQPTGRSPYEAL